MHMDPLGCGARRVLAERELVPGTVVAPDYNGASHRMDAHPSIVVGAVAAIGAAWERRVAPALRYA